MWIPNTVTTWDIDVQVDDIVSSCLPDGFAGEDMVDRDTLDAWENMATLCWCCVMFFYESWHKGVALLSWYGQS